MQPIGFIQTIINALESFFNYLGQMLNEDLNYINSHPMAIVVIVISFMWILGIYAYLKEIQ